MQWDGNFVIYDRNNVARWHTSTSGSGNYLVLQDDCNAVVRASNGLVKWQSGVKCR